MIVLEVPLRTPSLNTFNRGHWSGYHKLKKRWQEEIQLARGKARLWGRPQFPRAVILFERFAVQPILDTDNRLGGLKPVIDAMTDNGILLADDDQHVSYSVVEHRVAHRREERTRITLWVGADLSDEQGPVRRVGEGEAGGGESSHDVADRHVVDLEERGPAGA